MTAIARPGLWQIGKADFESSTRASTGGTLIRLVRTTDANVWPGRNRLGEKDATTTVWNGYVAGDVYGPNDYRWDCEAESYPTRKAALARLQRFIDRKNEVVQ